MKLHAALLLAALVFFMTTVQAATSKPRPWVPEAEALLNDDDFLGFRCLIRLAYVGTLSISEWTQLRSLITINASRTGYDLIPFWNARNPQGMSNLDKTLEHADGLMLANRFNEAFVQYQNMAVFIKSQLTKLADSPTPEGTKWSAEAQVLYPFILHSMGRALYGAGRFAESLIVYQWIGSGYPRFRQVQFEKMWAAFRSGRVEIALGAIASQRSAFFSEYLPSESYLLESYIYRRLCRDKDQQEVEHSIRRFQEKMSSNLVQDWAVNDVASRILLRLAQAPTNGNTTLISVEARKREQKLILNSHKQMYLNSVPYIKKGLTTALAYSDLSMTAGSSTALKPISSFSSRDEYFKRHLEIWPADSREDWSDEIGTHQFIGDSLCLNPGDTQ